MADQAARTYELVVPVVLPEGMTAEAFLNDARVEWRKGDGGRNPTPFSVGPDLDAMPRFTGPKELREVRP